MTTVLDKSVVKQALRELIQEEPELFEKILIKSAGEEAENLQNPDFEALIRKNFDRYEATFKALA